MKFTINIEEIDHESLVNLLSTALDGSLYLKAEYDQDFYNELEKRDDVTLIGNCFEGSMADVLLNGGTVYFYDEYSDGEIYDGGGEVITEPDGFCYTMYPVTLNMIIAGLNRAANGTYNVQNDSVYVNGCVMELINQDCDFDYFDYDSADTLMQIILFNEIIYG